MKIIMKSTYVLLLSVFLGSIALASDILHVHNDTGYQIELRKRDSACMNGNPQNMIGFIQSRGYAHTNVNGRNSGSCWHANKFYDYTVSPGSGEISIACNRSTGNECRLRVSRQPIDVDYKLERQDGGYIIKAVKK